MLRVRKPVVMPYNVTSEDAREDAWGDAREDARGDARNNAREEVDHLDGPRQIPRRPG